MNKVWSIAKHCLYKAYEKHPYKLHAFVLMSNHYHMVIQTLNYDLDKVMFEFNRRFSLILKNESGHINRKFGSRYKWSLITEDQYFMNVLRYVYQNPLRARICKSCERYPYSSLNQNARMPIKMERFGLSLEWLNAYLPENDVEITRKGLKRPLL